MLKRLWQTSPELVGTAAVMLVVLVGAVLGLAIDSRTITGAPAWLKPAKFAVSILIYTLTLAWIFTFIPEWRRTRRVIGWLTAVTMLIEIAIIGGQAGRGTTSHFNVGTPFDAVLFTVMGSAIVAQTVSTIAVAVALWRQRFADAALAWALRLGVSLTIVGAMTGGLMTRPTSAQLEAPRAGERVTVVGAHTVGAPDGGPGISGTGWSTEHGDLRVPHFIGLHAMQALPIVALLVGAAGLGAVARVRLVVIAAVSYGALYAVLLTQALRGISLVQPDTATVVQLGVWASVTGLAAAVAWLRADSATHTAAA